MESLEQVHQFPQGFSPKAGSSSLLSSRGCGKDYGSTRQSLWSLMAQMAQQWCDARPRDLPCLMLTGKWDGSEGHEVSATGAWHHHCAPTLPNAGPSLRGPGAVQGRRTLQPPLSCLQQHQSLLPGVTPE